MPAAVLVISVKFMGKISSPQAGSPYYKIEC